MPIRSWWNLWNGSAARRRLLESDAVLAIGHSPRVKLPERAGRLLRLRERCHGDSCFSIYDVERDAAPDEVALQGGA